MNSLYFGASFAGATLGIGAGCLKNWMIEPSIMTKRTAPIPEKGFVSQISSFYERLRLRPTPKQAFLSYLIVDFFPICLVVIEEVGKLLYKFQIPMKGALGQGGKLFMKLAVPTGMSFIAVIALQISTVGLGKCAVERYFRFQIDPSGHASIVCLNAFLRFQMLVLIATIGHYSLAYLTFATCMGLGEGIWIYKTTVNHHSTADMIAGCAIAALAISSYAFLSMTALPLLMATGQGLWNGVNLWN